jgi:hypothetical protein
LKKAGLIIAAALVAGGIYFAMKAKQVGKAAKFAIKGVKLSGTNIILSIGVQNPTNISLSFNSFVGELIAKGNAIANITGFTQTTIKPNAETVIPITCKLSGLGVLSLARQLLQKGGLKKLGATLVGTANINGQAMPIKLALA